MSIAAVTSRVEELQSLITRRVGSPADGQAGAFSAQMQAAVTSASPGAAGATPVAASGPAPAGENAFDDLIRDAAQRNGIDPALLKGLIRQESGFDPNAGSPAGAQGLTQLMPATAASLGVGDVHDPAQAIEGGAKYLAQQLKTFHGDEKLALAAYNAGPGAVGRCGCIPPYPETRGYVARILGLLAGAGDATALTGLAVRLVK